MNAAHGGLSYNYIWLT